MKVKFVSIIMINIILLSCLLSGIGAAGAHPPDKVPVIIGFKEKPDPSLVRGYEGDVKYTYDFLPAVSARMSNEAIQALKKNKNIAYVEPDYQVYALGETLPWGIDRIDAEKVHPYNKGTGARVAIIDTGIHYTHPDLDANYKGGYDFVNNDDDPMDDNGHGTHVAGTVAAEDNGNGVIGVAPEAYLYGIKVLNSGGSGYVSDVVAGIDWAIASDMQIISMSLGSDSDSITLHNACDKAYDAGIVVIAAAGNDGNRRGWGNSVDYPARYDSVIAVAATDNSDVRASWSSTGPAVELSAPGVSIYSTLPGNSFGSKSGTSMATPHVSGTAALILKSDETVWEPAGCTNGDGIWTNIEVRKVLDHTADDLGALGRDYRYGFGLVDADEAAPQSTPNQPPVADADGPYTGTEGIDLIFNGSDSYDPDGDPLTYSWDFGDGNTGTGIKPVHIYTAGGVYDITLVVNDGKEDSNPSTTTATITEVNDPPVADAGPDQTISDADGNNAEDVTLDGSGSYDPDGTITAFEWKENENLLSTDESFTYSFDQGIHNVILTVTDNDGANDTDEITITVNPNQIPTADADADRTAYVGETILFDGSGSQDTDGTIVSYSWDFDDGTTGTGETTTHEYSASGSYMVNLTVTDNGGAYDADTAMITITEAPDNTMHIQNIDMSIEKRWLWARALATITIVEASDIPVEGAVVSGHWEGLTYDTDSGNTGTDGKVTLYSNWVRRPSGTFTFIVDNVAKDGWTYDPGANEETSDSITA